MATLAAANVSALLMGYPVWQNPDITPFLTDDPPKAAPSVVNAEALGLPVYTG
jgi:hydroxypyruvate reductase 1